MVMVSQSTVICWGVTIDRSGVSVTMSHGMFGGRLEHLVAECVLLQLYDLMTMAFKYQVSLCLCPKDILLITLNHMDAMRKYVQAQSAVRQQVENVYRMLIEVRA